VHEVEPAAVLVAFVGQLAKVQAGALETGTGVAHLDAHIVCDEGDKHLHLTVRGLADKQSVVEGLSRRQHDRLPLRGRNALAA
jgi:hypothetical protein